MAETWLKLKEWPELILERIEDASVARIVLNRPDKRNAMSPALNASTSDLRSSSARNGGDTFKKVRYGPMSFSLSVTWLIDADAVTLRPPSLARRNTSSVSAQVTEAA